MPHEYLSLSLTTIFYLLAWVPSSVAKANALGLKWLLSNRSFQDMSKLSRWGQRSKRAYENFQDYFPGFAISVVLLGQLQGFNQGSSLACLIYLFARIGHFTSYTLGNITLRASFWTISMIANFYIIFRIIILIE